MPRTITALAAATALLAAGCLYTPSANYGPTRCLPGHTTEWITDAVYCNSEYPSTPSLPQFQYPTVVPGT